MRFHPGINAILEAAAKDEGGRAQRVAVSVAAAVSHARRQHPVLLDGPHMEDGVGAYAAMTGGLFLTLSAFQPSNQDAADFAVEVAHVVLVSVGQSGEGISRRQAFILWKDVEFGRYVSLEEIGRRLIELQRDDLGPEAHG